MISQFFVLSLRGDNIVFRDHRSEVQKGGAETLFRKVKFWKEDGGGDATPVFQGTKKLPATAISKSVVANDPGGRKRDEIFVDVIEKISFTFNSSGFILTSEIDGTIQLKSYLTGIPEIQLALNEDMSIGRRAYRSSSAAILDDFTFHESVNLDSFEVDRTLTLVPLDGEFPVMNYCMTKNLSHPFVSMH